MIARAVLVGLLLLAGCRAPGALPRGFDDLAAAAYTAIGSASDVLYAFCRNPAAGADCAPDALVSTETAQTVAGYLVEAFRAVQIARKLHDADPAAAAALDRLTDARRLVLTASRLLQPEGV